METFAGPRDFVEDTGYDERRARAVSVLDPETIDAPIRDLIIRFAALPHCFTLQSCYGHFVYEGCDDPQNLRRLPREDSGPVRYRIAYLALCLERGNGGIRLRGDLEALVATDREYVQFGSPDWFLEEHPNSYAVQVEPERFKDRDECVVGYLEALRIQQVRDEFFAGLRAIAAHEAALVVSSREHR